MKLNYFPSTDSLYIDLSEQTSVESREITVGVVLDIDNASSKVTMKKLILSNLPGTVETAAA